MLPFTDILCLYWTGVLTVFIGDFSFSISAILVYAQSWSGKTGMVQGFLGLLLGWCGAAVLNIVMSNMSIMLHISHC